ncbi:MULTISPECIES: head decoration protein [unclassified Aeromicrobium]|uniref:head decoration protein n=1 Tax=unclassified Aeromicrobium TaxID=2633570 RepID=UPI00288AA943|nr:MULTISPECIES: head decoration protein [unclassified Aeromicrobium]
MTENAVETIGEYVAEQRAWLAGPHGMEPGTTPSTTLDLSKFSDAKFAEVIKSGCVLGKVTGTDTYGPYDPAATDGRATAVGLLVNSFSTVRNKAGRFNARVIHAFVNESKLPYTGIGGLDADAKADLKHLILTGA